MRDVRLECLKQAVAVVKGVQAAANHGKVLEIAREFEQYVLDPTVKVGATAEVDTTASEDVVDVDIKPAARRRRK